MSVKHSSSHWGAIEAHVEDGAWFDPETPGEPGGLCKHGNPNVLTLDKGTSRLGQGPSAHSCLVDVEPYRGTVPPVTVFEPAKILDPSA